MRVLFLTLLSFVFLSGSAQAQIENYILETPHTQIMFGVDHLGFTKSYGKFHDYDGAFTFDRSKPENSSVEVTIQTASIDMGTKPWDDHMKNEDFFDVEKFPTMTFKSTAIEVTGDNTAHITGDLTILGQTHPVTLETAFNSAGKHAFSGTYHAGFSARGTLKRSEWGMTYGLPMIGDDVELIIEVDGIRQGDEPGVTNP